MKFMHIGDLHIGKTVNECSMLEDQKYILGQMLTIMEEEQVETLLIAGDVYDRSVPSAEAVELFDWFLTETTKKERKVCIISGNHDSGERLSFGKELLKKQEVYVIGNIEQSKEPAIFHDCYGSLLVWFLPFFRPAELKTIGKDMDLRDYNSAVQCLLEKMQLKKEERNLLLTHHFVINGGEEESIVCSDSEQRISVGGIEQVNYRLFDDFDYVALGHLHQAQKVGRETVRYSGSPIKYSFSEEFHKKSVVVFEMKEKGQVDWKLVPLTPLRDLRRIEGKLEELLKEEVVSLENKEDYLGVVLTDEEEIFDAISRVRAVYPNVMQLTFKREKRRELLMEQTVESVQERSPLELTKDFFGRVLGEEPKIEYEEVIEQWMEELLEKEVDKR